MDEFEIFWNDLTEECQKRLYDFLDGENGNYDVFHLQLYTKKKNHLKNQTGDAN